MSAEAVLSIQTVVDGAKTNLAAVRTLHEINVRNAERKVHVAKITALQLKAAEAHLKSDLAELDVAEARTIYSTFIDDPLMTSTAKTMFTESEVAVTCAMSRLEGATNCARGAEEEAQAAEVAATQTAARLAQAASNLKDALAMMDFTIAANEDDDAGTDVDDNAADASIAADIYEAVPATAEPISTNFVKRYQT